MELYSADLEKLLQGDAETIESFVSHSKLNGWCFISLGSLGDEARSMACELRSFFDNDMEEKAKETVDEHFGFHPVIAGQEGDGNHDIFKEKLSYVTGDMLGEDIGVPNLREFILKMDETAAKLASVISLPLFDKSVDEVADECHLPLLQRKNNDGGKRFAMFDVAHYLNQVKDGSPPINCASHYDPGLFALSVYSSMPGLQVRHSNGKWIDVPTDKGVVWYGHSAYTVSDGRCAHGLHRVVYPEKPDGTPRLTFWTEICTQKQLDNLLNPPPSTSKVTNVFPEMDKDVSRGKTMKKNPTAAEMRKIIPMSKTMAQTTVTIPVRVQKEEEEPGFLSKLWSKITGLVQKEPHGMSMTKPLYEPPSDTKKKAKNNSRRLSVKSKPTRERNIVPASKKLVLPDKKVPQFEPAIVPMSKIDTGEFMFDEVVEEKEPAKLDDIQFEPDIVPMSKIDPGLLEFLEKGEDQ